MNDENKLYERVLEIAKIKIGDLTWNNILFEANTEIKENTEEADIISEEIDFFRIADKKEI